MLGNCLLCHPFFFRIKTDNTLVSRQTKQKSSAFKNGFSCGPSGYKSITWLLRPLLLLVTDASSMDEITCSAGRSSGGGSGGNCPETTSSAIASISIAGSVGASVPDIGAAVGVSVAVAVTIEVLGWNHGLLRASRKVHRCTGWTFKREEIRSLQSCDILPQY